MSDFLLAQLYAIRAQVDAAILVTQASNGHAPMLIDPAETCPRCGSAGETQADTSTLDGTQRRKCLRCQVERVL